MRKVVKNTLNIILIAAAITTLVSGMFLMSGCKSGDIPIDEAVVPKDDTGAEVEESSGDSSEEEKGEDSSETAEELAEEEEAIEEEATNIEASQGDTEEVEETEETPSEITEEIETADDYFAEGLYAEAAKEYRDAARMIDDADISEGLKEELLAQISQNHQDAENITETARMHHSNSMTLQYEKRFEEAKAELEAALEIYPKYQTAVDALDSLEALMGLK